MVSTDGEVRLPAGKLFVRTWARAGDAGHSSVAAPIILFHDSLGCVELWRSFPARLCKATGRTVIAYDRLGFGKSDPHPDRLQKDFIADEARTAFAELRRQLGIERFVVLGHSVGGGMAIHCAARFADACEAVVTEAAQAYVEEITLSGIREVKADFERAGQMARLEKYHGHKAQWVLDAWTKTWLSPAFADWSLKDILSRVSTPLLAIHGSLDEYGSPGQAAKIVEWAGGEARAELLEGVHHVPHREVEGWIVALVSEFLGRADKR